MPTHTTTLSKSHFYARSFSLICLSLDRRPAGPWLGLHYADIGCCAARKRRQLVDRPVLAPGSVILFGRRRPDSIEEASRFLYAVTPYYPAGTVFLVVVDPGVGTSRKAIAVKSRKGQYFILPDNGVITPVLDRDGLAEAREISNQHWMIGATLSSTFHGRDIFSPAAAQ